MTGGELWASARKCAACAASWSAELALPAPAEPADLYAALCDAMSRRRGRPVQFRTAAFPPGTASGLWLDMADQDLVVIEERTAPDHQLVILGHELWHMKAGHCGHHVEGAAVAARLLQRRRRSAGDRPARSPPAPASTWPTRRTPRASVCCWPASAVPGWPVRRCAGPCAATTWRAGSRRPWATAGHRAEVAAPWTVQLLHTCRRDGDRPRLEDTRAAARLARPAAAVRVRPADAGRPGLLLRRAADDRRGQPRHRRHQLLGRRSSTAC